MKKRWRTPSTEILLSTIQRSSKLLTRSRFQSNTGTTINNPETKPKLIRKQSIERTQKFFCTLRTHYQAKRKLTKYATKTRKSWIPEGGFLYFDPKFIQRDSCWILSLWYRLQLAMLLESTKQNAVLDFRGTEKRWFLLQKKRSERSRLNSHLLTAKSRTCLYLFHESVEF